MTRFKFRAWNTRVKEMMANRDQGFEGDVFNWQNQGQDIVIMQSTGKRDKHGTEIYEGDIVKCVNDMVFPGDVGPNTGIFLITVDEGGFGYDFNWEHVGGYDCATHIMGHTGEDGNMCQVEIVGNFFENPEILGSV